MTELPKIDSQPQRRLLIHAVGQYLNPTDARNESAFDARSAMQQTHAKIVSLEALERQGLIEKAPGAGMRIITELGWAVLRSISDYWNGYLPEQMPAPITAAEQDALLEGFDAMFCKETDFWIKATYIGGERGFLKCEMKGAAKLVKQRQREDYFMIVMFQPESEPGGRFFYPTPVPCTLLSYQPPILKPGEKVIPMIEAYHEAKASEETYVRWYDTYAEINRPRLHGETTIRWTTDNCPSVNIGYHDKVIFGKNILHGIERALGSLYEQVDALVKKHGHAAAHDALMNAAFDAIMVTQLQILTTLSNSVNRTAGQVYKAND